MPSATLYIYFEGHCKAHVSMDEQGKIVDTCYELEYYVYSVPH